MTIFPTWYTLKATPDWTDVVWSSDAVTNFNLTVASIALYTMTNSTTTDLPEWTNLYYTETRVTANSTVVWKADKTNVIEKDSTTAYTPTLWTHPVNKDYADNMWTNINGLTAETTILDADELIFYDDSASINKKIWIDDFKIAIAPDVAPVQPAQTTTYLSSLWNDDTASTTFVTLKTYTATKSGAYRVAYTWAETLNSWSWWTTRIEVDWIIYWEFLLTANGSDVFLWVVHIVAWDAINFQAKQTSSWSNMRINNVTVKWT